MHQEEAQVDLIRNRFPAASRALWSHLAPRRKPRPERAAQLPAAAELGGLLRAFRAAALWGIAVLIATATGSAFTESYRGLFEWAGHHDFDGFWAAAFPLQVDLFIAVGELVLFIAMLDAWQRRDQAGAWAVALLGLAVSVAGNVGHVAATDLQSRGTAAVPPVAAFGALWLGLGVLKRILRTRQGTAAVAAQTAQATAAKTAEATRLSEVLDGLTDAFLLLARRDAEAAPAPALSPVQAALLTELTETVRGLRDEVSGVLSEPVPADAESAALAALKATTRAGNPLSQRQLEVRFGLSRGQAARVREGVPQTVRYAELNGAPS
jgi:Protein of unknown function (DUF2637)